MKPVTVAAYNSPTEAEPLKQRLEAAGIPAEIRSEAKSDKILEFVRVNAGVRVEVPREHFEKALLIMHDWEVEKDTTAAQALGNAADSPAPIAWTTPENHATAH